MNSMLYIFLIYLVPIDPFVGTEDGPRAFKGWWRIITMLASEIEVTTHKPSLRTGELSEV